MKSAEFVPIDIGDRVIDFDSDGEYSCGIVVEIEDIHNVHVKFFWAWFYESGGGFNCLDPDCEMYNGDCLYLLNEEEYNAYQRETMSTIVENKLFMSYVIGDPFCMPDKI